jgi:hypothetical protein
MQGPKDLKEQYLLSLVKSQNFLEIQYAETFSDELPFFLNLSIFIAWNMTVLAETEMEFFI